MRRLLKSLVELLEEEAVVDSILEVGEVVVDLPYSSLVLDVTAVELLLRLHGAEPAPLCSSTVLRTTRRASFPTRLPGETES